MVLASFWMAPLAIVGGLAGTPERLGAPRGFSKSRRESLALCVRPIDQP
jgi:hypothetical protein